MVVGGAALITMQQSEGQDGIITICVVCFVILFYIVAFYLLKQVDKWLIK